MIVHREYEQGSEAWMRARASIPTASEFHNLVTPKGKIKDGEMPKTYLASKLAEKWIGGPLPGFGSWATEQGKIRESEAIPGYSFDTGIEIDRVAFCTTDDGKIGCSPDGLIGGDGGIEVKCPEPQTQVKYLMAGIVPDDYIVQVQGSLLVTRRTQWTFLSYAPKFPSLIIQVEPDPLFEKAIEEALFVFLERFDEGWKKLCELNGGEPPPKREPAKDRPRFTWESDTNDVPH